MMVPINMKIKIVNILSETVGLTDFSTDYPDDWNVFPYAIYRTSTRSNYVDSQKDEARTEWTVVIEIYGKKSVSSIASHITTSIRKLGFQVDVRDANVIGLKRIVLTCRAIVDNKTGMVYQ